MSIVADILTELWNSELKYGGMTVNIFGIPRFKKYPKHTLRTTIDRMTRQKLITKELGGLVLSSAGKNYLKKKHESLKSFERNSGTASKRIWLLCLTFPKKRKLNVNGCAGI